MNIYITLDYELFFAQESGSVEKSIIEPTQKLLDVVEHLGDKIDSLKYRTHVNDTLNSLVRKGLIGKITYGKRVLFLTPEEAVIQAMKDLEMLPTRCNIKKIAEYTNLDIHKVVRIIEKMI